jgi:hypothetical protein
MNARPVLNKDAASTWVLLATQLFVLVLTATCFFSLTGTSGTAGSIAEQPGELELWYRQPAAKWLEAMPLGNGLMGAMVFGGT